MSLFMITLSLLLFIWTYFPQKQAKYWSDGQSVEHFMTARVIEGC